MLSIKQGILLSAIVDKMNIKIENPEGSQAQVGADLVIQMASKAYRAEEEIYSLVASVKGCSVEEAPNINLAEFLEELTGNPAIMDFLKSAVK